LLSALQVEIILRRIFETQKATFTKTGKQHINGSYSYLRDTAPVPKRKHITGVLQEGRREELKNISEASEVSIPV